MSASPSGADLNLDLLKIVRPRYPQAHMNPDQTVVVPGLGAVWADEIPTGLRVTASPPQPGRDKAFRQSQITDSTLPEVTWEALGYLEAVRAELERRYPADPPDPAACRGRLIDRDGSELRGCHLRLELTDEPAAFAALRDSAPEDWRVEPWQSVGDPEWPQAWFILRSDLYFDVIIRVDLDWHIEVPPGVINRLASASELRASVLLKPGGESAGPIRLPQPADPEGVLDRVERALRESAEP